MRYKNLLSSELARKIIKSLKGLQTPTMLSKKLKRSRQTISDVLSTLHKKGIVKKVKRGKEVYYWIDELRLKQYINTELEKLRKIWYGVIE